MQAQFRRWGLAQLVLIALLLLQSTVPAHAQYQRPDTFRKGAVANRATNVAPKTTLVWAEAAGATTYTYCLAAHPTGCRGDEESLPQTTLTNVRVDLNPDTRYYWQVWAHNAHGTTPANSESGWWSFTTGHAPNKSQPAAPAASGTTAAPLGPSALNAPMPALVAPAGQVVAGRLPSQFNVTSAGAPNFGVSLDLPPGTGGMAPQILVNYDHQNGASLLGTGWSLGGSFSMITRCPATLGQHGVSDPVDFDANDQFCLDGQLLVATQGVPGAGGTEYRTVNQTFARVISYGQAGGGPLRFTVWTQAGLIMDYGATADSRMAATGRSDVLYWGLNRVSDTRGNYFTVAYEQTPTGEAYPIRMSYTGNAATGLAPYAAVEFVYEQRPDVLESYVGGSVVRLTRRLQVLRMRVDATLVREYRFGYDQSAMTGRSRLISLTECASDGSCLAATTFTWTTQAPTDHTFFAPGSAHWNLTAVGTEQHVADFDHDGRDDVAVYEGDSSPRICLAAVADLTPCPLWALPGGVVGSHFIGDVNGDGLPDVIGQVSDGSWQVCRSDGAAFDCGSTTWRGPFETSDMVRVADVNGDRRSDLLGYAGDGRWDVCLSTGTNFACDGLNWNTYAIEPANTILADLNGDTLVDLLGYSGNGLWRACRSTGSSFDCDPFYWVGPNGGIADNLVGDVNADGLTDLISDLGNGLWRVCRSTGVGFECGPAPWAGHAYGQLNTVAGDWNGDGRTDIAAYTGNELWQVCVSTGTNFACDATLWPGLDRGAVNTLVGDFNGDGKQDMLVPHSFATWAVALAGGPPTDLVTAFTDGYGAQITVQYQHLGVSTVYQRETGSAYPVLDLGGAFYVVSAVTRDTGVGVLQRTRYTYAGLKYEQLIRSSLGFRQMTVIDEQTGITTSTVYAQDPFFKGQALSQEQRLANGTLIQRTTNQWARLALGPTFYPYNTRSTEERFELDGSATISQTTTTDVDLFGNPIRVTLATSDGIVKTTTSTYVNDANRWLLGRLVQARVIHQAPGQPNQTLTSAFANEPITGLLIQEVIEPKSTLTLTKTYDYDVYGNIVRSTTSGADFLPRSQVSVYDPRGQFVTRSINELGQGETRVSDPLLGKLVQITSPNGLTSTVTYDPYGRVRQELRPDLTQTTTSYVRCGVGNCPPRAVYLTQVTRTGAPTLIRYFDLLDRVVREETVGFDGRLVFVDTQYNAFGNKSRVSAPYFSGEVPLWTSYNYDILGRVTQLIQPDGSTTTTIYAGLTTRVIDALGHSHSRTMNSQGWLLQSTDALGGSVRYTYDSIGHPITQTDAAGNVTRMTYDLRGQQLTITAPGLGTTTSRYNTLGELIWQQSARAQVCTFRYDLLGRLLERREPEGVTTWIYDTAPFGIGKIARVQGLGGYQEVTTYDTLGRVSRTTVAIDGQIFAFDTTYDSAGRTRMIRYPTGLAVLYTYNTNGYLADVRNATTNALYWQANAINPRGQLIRETLGNGLITQRGYDPATGRLGSIQTGTTGAPTAVQNLAYTFNPLGDLTSRSDKRQLLTERFSYDQDDRLLSAQVDLQPAVTVTYDPVGNIKTKSDIGTYSYGVNVASPYAVTSITGVRPQTYRYDTAGNRISSGTGTVAYTPYGKPSQITEGTRKLLFTYDPSYNLIKKVSGTGTLTTTTLMVGGLYEREVATQTIHRQYIVTGGTKVLVVTQGAVNQTLWMHTDHLGSPETITNQSVTVVERQSYDAWGQPRALNWRPITTVTAGVINRGFTGHQPLIEVGLVHMGGRVYDPMIGRFLSADPFIQEPENLQNLNRYSYVLNNPLSYTDPTGYFFKQIWKAITNFFKENWRALVTVAVSIVTMGVASAITGVLLGASTFSTAMISGAAAGFVGNVTGTLLYGGSLSQALRAGVKGAVIGGISAGAYSAIGTAAMAGLPQVAAVVAHGAVGGLTELAQGGRFEHGFLSAAFTHAFSPAIDAIDCAGCAPYRVAAAAVIGGTAAEIGGGKFANGAITGAFSRLYNDEGHPSRQFQVRNIHGSAEELASSGTPWEYEIVREPLNGQGADQLNMDYATTEAIVIGLPGLLPIVISMPELAGSVLSLASFMGGIIDLRTSTPRYQVGDVLIHHVTVKPGSNLDFGLDIDFRECIIRAGNSSC